MVIRGAIEYAFGMTIHIARPDLLAHQNAVRLPFAALVQELREMLGARLVAYLGGVKATRQVSDWAEARRLPSQLVQDRLRASYQIAQTLAAAEEPAVIQAWFQGMNPKLDDVSPARALRESTIDDVASQVMAAARAFLAS